MERLKRDPSFERKFAAAEANVRQKFNANGEDFGWGEAKPIGYTGIQIFLKIMFYS